MGVKMRFNGKGQVTIFIILALIIVVAIALIYVLINPLEVKGPSVQEPNSYIEKCVRDATKEAVGILSPQGGDIEPTNYKLHKNIKRNYLCYNQNYYESCINQEPMLIEHIEKEITDYIWEEVEGCFEDLKKELESKKYDVEMEDMKIETELVPKKIIVNVNRDFKMSKNGETRKFTKFKSQVIHPIYDLAKIALEIANQEAKYGNFETLGYMILYPDYDIERFVTGDDVKIYTIKERRSEKEFVFAIRGCVIPAGF